MAINIKELGYDEVARVCLTHSFNNQKLEDYVGKYDVGIDVQQHIQDLLNDIIYDDDDRLIQLCDALAGSEGILDIEERMQDVKERYGFYPQDKWDQNLALKAYFETQCQQSIEIMLQNEKQAIFIDDLNISW